MAWYNWKYVITGQFLLSWILYLNKNAGQPVTSRIMRNKFASQKTEVVKIKEPKNTSVYRLDPFIML